MSTNASITVKNSDGKYHSVYLHWDGATALPILEENYDTLDKAMELVMLGDLSTLDKSAECPFGHSFDTPERGYCIAYGRDRGEKHCKTAVFTKFADLRNTQFQQHNYIFRSGEWSKV